MHARQLTLALLFFNYIKNENFVAVLTKVQARIMRINQYTIVDALMSDVYAYTCNFQKRLTFFIHVT